MQTYVPVFFPRRNPLGNCDGEMTSCILSARKEESERRQTKDLIN